MNLVSEKRKCCGCGGCENICPQNAIKMIEDEFGFKYPVINDKICINCGACEKYCAFQSDIEFYSPKNSYAASNIVDEKAILSASGGVFYTMAEMVLNREGIIIGTSFDDLFNTCVCIVTSKEQINTILGSKYVQSDMGRIYQYIMKEAKRGTLILFGGTPCQVAEVRQIVGKKSNVLLIDIVCHGVPNNRIFKDYLGYLTNKRKAHIVSFKFRDKLYGQDTTGSVIYEKKGVYYNQRLESYKSSYYSLFLKGLLFRESCYECKYATSKRVGDITICDFWGIEDEYPEIESAFKKKGAKAISGVLVNTELGEVYYREIEKKLMSVEVTLESIRKNNPQLNHPFMKNETERMKVLALYAREGYCAIENYYRKHFWPLVLRRSIIRFLPKSFVKALLKIRGN